MLVPTENMLVIKTLHYFTAAFCTGSTKNKLDEKNIDQESQDNSHGRGKRKTEGR